jgi:hypothetical protein
MSIIQKEAFVTNRTTSNMVKVGLAVLDHLDDAL